MSKSLAPLSAQQSRAALLDDGLAAPASSLFVRLFPPKAHLAALDVARMAILAGAYYESARLSLHLALVREQVTPIWLPAGIAVVVLLLVGRRMWPGVALGAFAVNAPLDAIFISVVSPFKGTVLRDDMLNGRFGDVDSQTMQSLDQLFPTACSETLTLEQLTRMQRNAYFRFYAKPRSLLHLGKKLTNRRNVRKIVRAVARRVHNREMVSLN